MKYRNSLLVFSTFFLSPLAYCETYRVTPDAASGTGDGMSWKSPMTIHEAAAKQQPGDVILCKAGVYTPSARIEISQPITVKGGLAGVDDTTMASNGERSIFDAGNSTAINEVLRVKTLSGAETTNVFEHIEVRNAYRRGVLKTGVSSLVFRDCAFTACCTGDCGVTLYDTMRGGAGCFYGAEIGGGASSATLSFEDCVFACNAVGGVARGSSIGFGAAAAFKNWGRVFVDNTLFVSNGLDSAFTFAKDGLDVNNVRGAAIYSEAPLTVRKTRFQANVAGISAAYGGIVYIKDASSDSAFTNCLFEANSCEHCNYDQNTKEGGVVVFRTQTGDRLDVVNCTFAYNLTDGKNVSAGIDVGGGTAVVKNTIFHGAQKGARLECGKDMHVSSGATAHVDYCLFEENSSTCFSAAGTLNMGEHNLFGDPLFAVAPSSEDIQGCLTVKGDYTGYAADAFNTVFAGVDVHAMNRKLTVDVGDPISPYGNEPKPNGRRVNLGFYGNTSEALSSICGMYITVR